MQCKEKQCHCSSLMQPALHAVQNRCAVCISDAGVRLALNYSQEDTGKKGPVFLSLWLTMDWPLALRPHLQEPVMNGLSDAFNFDITWGEPGRHYGERFWLDEWGMRYLSRENLRFDTQDALLAKLAAPAFYIKCDVGLEGSEKDV